MASTGKELGSGVDYSRSPVPETERSSRGSLTMSWWGCCSSIFWIILSATMAEMYGTTNTIIGILLACLTYSVICGVIAKYAITTGVSVSLFSRLLFGTRGAAIATLIFSISALWYAVFEGSVIAVAATYAFPWLSNEIASLIVVLLSIPLVIGKVQTWLNKLNAYLLPVYVIGLCVAVYLAIHLNGYSSEWLTAPGTKTDAPLGWWNVYVAYLGVWTLIMFCFDYARFGRKEDSRYHTLFNFGMPFYVVTMLVAGIIGIFIVKTMHWEGAVTETAAVKALVSLMGVFGVIFVWATQTRINSANFYLATINLEAFYGTVTKKRLPTIISGSIVAVLVYLTMLAGVFHSMMTALAYQGIFVVAWVAIALSHIAFNSPNEPQDAAGRDDSAYPSIRIPGLLSWAIAVVAGIVTMHSNVESFASPITAILGFFLYYVFTKLGAKQARAASLI